MNTKNEAKRLAKNTGLIAIGNLGAKLISFILLPLYTSILSPSDYGKYDFIITLSFFITPIVSMLIFESLFRFLIEARAKKEEDKIRGIISSSIIINLISIILYVMLSLIIYLIFNIDYIPILTLYVISVIIYTFFVSLLRGIDQIKFYALYSSIKNILQVSFSYLAIVTFSLGINGLLYASIISSLGISLIIVIHFKLWKYFVFKRKYKNIAKELIKYSIPLIPDSISTSIVSMSDRIVVKQFISTEANGIYSISHKFPSIIEIFYHFFITAWNESASRVYEIDKTKMQEYYQELYDFTKYIVVSSVMCLIAFMPILFKILIRGDYIESFKYVPILLVSQILNSISSFYSGILIAYKDTKCIAKSTIFSALINVILNIIFVFIWGIYGVLIATLISNIVLVVLRNRSSSKYIRLKEKYLFHLITFILFIIIFKLYNYSNIYLTSINIILSVLFFIIINRKLIAVLFKMMFKKLSIKRKYDK